MRSIHSLKSFQQHTSLEICSIEFFFLFFSLIIHYFHEKFPRIPSSLLLKTCSVFKIILPLLSLPCSFLRLFILYHLQFLRIFYLLLCWRYFFSLSLSKTANPFLCADDFTNSSPPTRYRLLFPLLYATPETLQNSADGKASCIAWDGWLGVVGKNERETFERSEKRDRTRERWRQRRKEGKL